MARSTVKCYKKLTGDCEVTHRVTRGEDATYEIFLSNPGPDEKTYTIDDETADVIASGVVVVTLTNGATTTATAWPLAGDIVLPAASSVKYEVTLTTDAAAPCPSVFTNVATLTTTPLPADGCDPEVKYLIADSIVILPEGKDKCDLKFMYSGGRRSMDLTALLSNFFAINDAKTFAKLADAIENGFTIADLLP